MPVDIEVMLPAYGDRPMLLEAIESVLAQDDPDWRLTIIDDAAANGGDILADWIRNRVDPRIRYLTNPRRLGINRNFQRCVDECSADWVIVLGDDDRLLPDCISRIRRTVSELPDTSWVHTGARVIDGAGRPILPMADWVKRRGTPRVDVRREMRGEELAVSLLVGNWMYFPSCAFRRDVLQRHGFRPGYDIVMDLDLFLRILLDDGVCVLLEQPGIAYRRHAASVSSSKADDGSRFTEEAVYFQQMATAMAQVGWPRAAAAARRHWTSRLHALAKVPPTLAARNRKGAAALVRAAFATSRTPAPWSLDGRSATGVLMSPELRQAPGPEA